GRRDLGRTDSKAESNPGHVVARGTHRSLFTHSIARWEEPRRSAYPSAAEADRERPHSFRQRAHSPWPAARSDVASSLALARSRRQTNAVRRGARSKLRRYSVHLWPCRGSGSSNRRREGGRFRNGARKISRTRHAPRTDPAQDYIAPDCSAPRDPCGSRLAS